MGGVGSLKMQEVPPLPAPSVERALLVFEGWLALAGLEMSDIELVQCPGNGCFTFFKLENLHELASDLLTKPVTSSSAGKSSMTSWAWSSIRTQSWERAEPKSSNSH